MLLLAALEELERWHSADSSRLAGLVVVVYVHLEEHSAALELPRELLKLRRDHAAGAAAVAEEAELVALVAAEVVCVSI